MPADAGSSPDAGVPDGGNASSNVLGANLGWCNTWDPTQHFADLAKHARRLTIPGVNQAVVLDTNGNPTADFQLLIAEGSPNIATGTYPLRFMGQATVTCNGCTLSGQTYDSSTDITSANVGIANGNANIFIQFTSTWRRSDHLADATGNAQGLTNISVARPGHDLTQTAVNAQLAARLTAFRVLRPMQSVGWGNPDVNWTDRGLPGAAGWGDNYDRTVRGGASFGANWEYLILLANETGKDLWINVPQLATDDYVTKLAQLFAFGSSGSDGLPFTGSFGSATARPAPSTFDPYNLDATLRSYPPLRSDLHLYVEWSNETWNFGAVTSGWNLLQTRLETAPNWVPITAYVTSTNPWDQPQVYNAGNTYRCITSGTSAGTSGPTGTAADIVDGTAHWAFVGPRSTFDPMKLGASSTGSGAFGQSQRRNAAMAVRNSLIFRAVFGDGAMMTRVRPLYASQLAWHAIFSEGHDYLMHLHAAGTIQTADTLGATTFAIQSSNPVPYYIWTYATAPYINYFAADAGATLDSAFVSLNQELSQSVGLDVDYEASLARDAGVHLSCYEGGQDLNHGEAFMNQVQADPRIEQLTIDLIHRLTQTNADVADVFNYYTLTGNGNYGLSPNLTSATSYKWQAIDQIAAGH